MRHHTSVLLVITGSFLLGLAGCAGDSMKSSQPAVEEGSTSTVVQGESEPGKSSSGEVQERAVPGMVRPAPGTPVPSTGVVVIPGQVSPVEVPTDMGLFAIRTPKNTFVTALGAGGRITDVFRTDMVRSQDWEQFRLLLFPKAGYLAIQTYGGYFVTAVGGGGQTTDALHTDATQIQAWEHFQFRPPPSLALSVANELAITTVKGNLLTAVGGGGQTTNAFRTDARIIGATEIFRLVKCGDLGSGQMQRWPNNSIYTLLTITGGTVIRWGAWGANELNSAGAVPEGMEFSGAIIHPIRQPDGSYVLSVIEPGAQDPTTSRYYMGSPGILSATSGGGLVPQRYSSRNAPGGYTYSEVLPLTPPIELAGPFTNSSRMIAANEKFRLVDQGDCTYVIQTNPSGLYLGLYKPDPSHYPNYILFSTDRTTVSDAAKFRLVVGGNDFMD